MKRRAFQWAAVVSLVLAAAAAGLFVHSGWRYGYVMWCGGRGTAASLDWEVGSARGRVYVIRVHHPASYSGGSGWHVGGGPGSGPAEWTWRVWAGGIGFGAGGFNWYHAMLGGTDDFRQVVVPHYFFVGVFGVMAWWCWRRGKVAPAGMCAACGYDLRATPGRCPECGMEAAVTAGTVARAVCP